MDLLGVVGVTDLVNVLYFCFASTYLYRKSRSMQATASAVVSESQSISTLRSDLDVI
jgi:hypothetical protein